MPSKQGVRGHVGSQSAALVVGQPELPTLHLFLEDAVLLHEVGDDVGLVAVNQAGERYEEDLERVDLGQH